MPKAEGFTYGTSKESIYYSQVLDSDDSNTIFTDYNTPTQQIRGDKFLSNKGMLRAAPEGYFTYSGSTSRYGGISNLAKEGTAILGEEPFVRLERKTGQESTKRYTIEYKNYHLTIKDYLGNTLSTDKYYSEGIKHIKIWIAATGAGGGAGGDKGAGGGAGGFALFPAILQNGDSIIIELGDSGHGGDDTTSPKYWGYNGENTIIYENSYDKNHIIALIQSGWGGYGGTHTSSIAAEYIGGGGVYLYGASYEGASDALHREAITTILPSGWVDLLNCKASDLKCSLPSPYAWDSSRSFSYTSSYIVAYTGGYGGASYEGVGGGRQGQSILAYSTAIDFKYPYNKPNWTSSGGAISVNTSASANHASGGGASAFYGSIGGDGKYLGGSDKDPSNGTIGGGAGAGGSSRGGGWGGYGAADIWVP